MAQINRLLSSEDRFIERAQKLVEAATVKTARPDLEDLATLSGVDRVVLSPTLAVSGQLVWNGRALVIELNTKESAERRNFTCCHEIAHTFCFDGSVVKFRGAAHEFKCAPNAVEERLCDRAASEMLLPAKFFVPAASNFAPSIDAV